MPRAQQDDCVGQGLLPHHVSCLFLEETIQLTFIKGSSRCMSGSCYLYGAKRKIGDHKLWDKENKSWIKPRNSMIDSGTTGCSRLSTNLRI